MQKKIIKIATKVVPKIINLIEKTLTRFKFKIKAKKLRIIKNMGFIMELARYWEKDHLVDE